MTSKRSEINNINSFDSRPILKDVNVQKPKGLKVRESSRNEDQNKREIDENVYAKPKLGIFKKGVSQRPPLTVITAPAKPSFTIYCDDDTAKDGYDASNLRKTSMKDRVEQTPPVDFSAWHESKDENVKYFSEATASKVSVSEETVITDSAEGGNLEKHKGEDEEDDVFFSTLDDNSSAFHTAQQLPEKLDFSLEETLPCYSDYHSDTYSYMRAREVRLCPNSRYLRKQTDITYEMRYILVDWLADVTVEYDLSLECLHLAVSIVDRTLSLLYCPHLKLQLVGATAIMIATKFEEIFPPELKEFVYITAETYTAAQILRMEKVILNTLRFEISAPTSNWFAARLARRAQCSKQTFFVMNYLLELALLDYRYLRYRSSILACAALCLANIITGCVPWSPAMKSDTGVSMDEIREPLHKLLISFSEAPNSQHKAVYEKYSDARYAAVASLHPPRSLPVD